MVCVDHDGVDARALLQHQRFGVSILAIGAGGATRAASPTRIRRDRFDGIGYSRGESGVVLLDDALAHLECRVVARHDAGDHTIFVGEVERATARDGRPLLYYRGGYAQLER